MVPGILQSLSLVQLYIKTTVYSSALQFLAAFLVPQVKDEERA